MKYSIIKQEQCTFVLDCSPRRPGIQLIKVISLNHICHAIKKMNVPTGMMMLRCHKHMYHVDCEFSNCLFHYQHLWSSHIRIIDGLINALRLWDLICLRTRETCTIATTKILTMLSVYCNCGISTVVLNNLVTGDLSLRRAYHLHL